MKKSPKKYKFAGKLKLNSERFVTAYASGYVTFFLTTKPVSGVVEQMSANYLCREEYIDMFKFNILRQLGCKSKMEEFSEAEDGDLKCGTRKAYVGVKSISSIGAACFLDSMMSALDVINVLEKRYGWPLTVMYRITNQNSVLFCGSNKWIKTPFALSLYTLLMRIGETSLMRNMYAEISNKYERYDSFVNTMKQVDGNTLRHTGKCNPMIPLVSYNDNRTLCRVVETISFWDLFMEKYDTIFKGRSFLSNYGYRAVTEWCRKNPNDYSYPSIYVSEADGLYTLVTSTAVDLEICRRFKRLTEAT